MTEDQRHENGQNLNDFVSTHKLMNSHSIIHFYGIVTIQTAINKITNQRYKMMIKFDGYEVYGDLTILESSIDPNFYPTVFRAKYHIMRHINHEYLEIVDVHPNPDIGKYSVRIIPLERAL